MGAKVSVSTSALQFEFADAPKDDGRDFTSADRPDGETRVAVMNRTAAASLWPGTFFLTAHRTETALVEVELDFDR